MKGRRRQGRQRKRWEDNIREWTGLGFAKSQRAVENREKMEETGCEIICGAPTTFQLRARLEMMMSSHTLAGSNLLISQTRVQAASGPMQVPGGS